MSSPLIETGAGHILIVDDHPDTRIILRHYFEAKGFNVREAHDGIEALAEMRASRPDAVILDIQMPHLDGIGVLKAVRSDEVLREIPILALSAHALSDEVQRIKDAGASLRGHEVSEAISLKNRWPSRDNCCGTLVAP